MAANYDDFDDFDDSPEVHQNPNPNQKKHKGKANGFLKFMLQYRREKGLNMNQCQEQAGEIWEKMTMAERSKYDGKSIPSNNNRNEAQKFTSFGVSFETLDRQKREALHRIKKMELTIEQMLQTALEENRLKALTFYFFSASYFVQTLDYDIFPAEIALSKFSLDEGVYDTFHTLINPGELPLGYAHEATQRSSSTHKFKLPPNIEGETDYSVIFGKMMAFLGVNVAKRQEFPVLFVDSGTRDDELKAAKMALEKIVRGTTHQLEFRVYPAENLLFKLHKKCAEVAEEEVEFNNVMMAKEMMNRDKFMFSDLGCKFHLDEDCSTHCCLSKVCRCGYTMSLYCLFDADIKIPGRHFPATDTADNALYDDHSTDSGWDSDLTGSFSRIRIHSEPSRTSNVVTAMNSAMSMISKEASAISIQTVPNDEVQAADSSMSISSKIKKAAVSVRGRNRHP